MRIIVLLLCAFTSLGAQEYNLLVIPEELKKDAHVVIRENKEDYVINSINNIEIKKSKVWTILKKDGEGAATIALHYDKSTKVDDIKVVTYNAFGKEVSKFSKKDFSDYSNTPSYGLYVDNRILLLKVSSTSFPFTIKLSYTENTSDTVFIGDFHGLDDFNTSVEKSTRTINNKSGIPLRTKVKNSDYGKVNATENGNLYTYTYANIPAIDEEKQSPTISYLSPTVEFSLEKFNLAGKIGDAKDWNSFGKWYYQNLLVPVSTITPDIKNEIASLNLSGSTEEKVRTIFQYMQQKTRYVFVAMGIGGWMPMEVDDVRKKGYGDCKALTNYMRAMLDVAGIPSHYAIIKSDASPLRFDNDFPKMGGNHAILVVPTDKGNIWLENTSQTVAYNHLSYNTTNRNVLAVGDNGIQIIDTPVYPAEKSLEKIHAKIKLKEDKSIDAVTLLKYTGGQYDFNMSYISLAKKEMEDAMKERYSHLRIDKMEVNDFKNDKNEAIISYGLKFNSPDFSKKLGNDLFFGVVPFTDYSINSSDTKRDLPFETKFAFKDDYTIEYEAPEGYKFPEVPKGTEITSEFGSYKIDFQLENNKLIVHRVLSINKGLYPKEKYAQYVDFRKKTTFNDNTKVLISKL